MNKLISIIVFLTGISLSYGLYSYNTTNSLRNYGLIMPIIVAAVIAVTISIYLYNKINGKSLSCLLSVLISYFAYFIILVVGFLINEEYFVFVAFSPIIFRFLFPITLMSWLSVFLYFKFKKINAEQGHSL